MTAAQIAEAVYGTIHPKWWHTDEQRERFRKIIDDAAREGKIIDCPRCRASGCRRCDWRGVIMPGVTW